jgi:Tfp pilus assembly protein PilN
MIKINLLAERKPTKAKPTAGIKMEGAGSGSNLLLIAILVAGVAAAGGWWYTLNDQVNDWQTKIAEADQELERLKEARAKGERYEAQKALLARKINLITDLKRQQVAPVRILDQISRNLPEFLWLDTMAASANNINISGKATTYNAVSNFYANLTESGLFQNVSLGRTFQVPEGVAFSLTCSFSGVSEDAETTQG